MLKSIDLATINFLIDKCLGIFDMQIYRLYMHVSFVFYLTWWESDLLT